MTAVPLTQERLAQRVVVHGTEDLLGVMGAKPIHIMTPETQTSTHYLWAIARHNAIHDEQLSKELQMVGEGAFMEDKVALEEIEEIYRRDQRPGFREKIIKTDAGGIRVLRMIARMAAEEQAESGEIIAAE